MKKEAYFYKEEGFTLIEILVVVLIIGILSAIAIPVFSNQRKTAIDAKITVDVKNLALATEQYFNDNPTAIKPNAAEIKQSTKITSGTSNYFVMGTRDDWCVTGADPNAKQYTDITPWVNGAPYLTYSSTKGGLTPTPTGISAETCNINRARI